MRLYRYIFYVLFRWTKRSPEVKKSAQTAFYSLSFLVFLNLFTPFVALRFFSDLNFLSFITKMGETSKLFYAIPLIVLAIPQYFYLLNNQRYLAIIEEFKDETKEQKLKGNIITIIYVVLSLLSFFLVLYFGGKVFQARHF